MRDCANCFHRKPVLKEDGTWTAECEKWDCEFQSRENMVEKTEAKQGEITNEDIQQAIKEGFANGYEMAKSKFERPQGEWGKWVISEIRCPNCLEYFQTDCYSTEELKKCPNCGVQMDMRGEEE